MPLSHLLSPARLLKKPLIKKRSIRRILAGVAAIAASALLAPNLRAANNPVPFVDIVSPVSIRPGASNVTLTVRETGFVTGSTVLWNRTALTTTWYHRHFRKENESSGSDHKPRGQLAHRIFPHWNISSYLVPATGIDQPF